MGITYGGVSLSHPTADVLAKWDRWRDRLAQETLRSAAYHAPGLDHLPTPAFLDHDVREKRLNVLVWPTGASRWAYFRGLVTGKQLAAIQAAATSAGNPLELVIGTTLDGGRQVRPSMHMLPPRVVFDGASLTYPLYEITLVDERWFWWQATSGTAPVVTSWANLLSGLLTAAGCSAQSIETIPSGYSTPTAARWTGLTHKPLPLLIDAAAESVGCRVVRSTGGTTHVVTAATARTTDESNWTAYRSRLEIGGRATESAFGPSLPEKVTVIFEGATPATADVTLNTTAVYAGVTGQAGRVGVVHADLPATANTTLRTAYAAQAAADWYRLAAPRTDAVFGGVCSWTPTGLEDRTEYEWVVPCETYPDGRVLTRVVPGPAWDRNRYGGRTTAEDTDAATACREKLLGLTKCACLTGEVTRGTGGCANVAPATVAFAYDADAGGSGVPGWKSSAFTTAGGATRAAVYLDTNNDVRGTLTTAAVGSTPAATRPLMYVGCQNGKLKFAAADCLFCNYDWQNGCDGNKFYLLVDCAQCPPPAGCALCGMVGKTAQLDNTGGGGVPAGTHFATVTLVDGNPTAVFVISGSSDVTVYCDTRTGAMWVCFGAVGGPTCTQGVYVPSPPVPATPTTSLTTFTGTFTDIGTLTFSVDCGGTLPGTTGCSPCPPCSGCYDAAGEPLSGRPDVVVDFKAASHTFAWSGTNWFKIIAGDKHTLACSGGTWTLLRESDGASATATTQTCRPFGLVFPGVAFGEPGDITVSLAA